MLLRRKNTENNNRSDLFSLLTILAIILLINVIGQFVYTYFDFTDDNRFTLSEPTKDLVKNQKDIIFVKVLLAGDFPAGFKRLQQAVINTLDQFQSLNSKIDYIIENPMEGSPENINANIEKLREEGIAPVNLFIGEGNSKSTKRIYPYAILNYGKRVYVVNLLEPNAQGISEEEALNNSIALLEYKFANAIQKLNAERKGNIVFISDKGGIDDYHLASLYKQLNQFYYVAKTNIDSTFRIVPEIDLVIVVKPQKPFSKKNQFVLDQYLLKGGKIIWLIDKLDVNLDSINKYKMFTPRVFDLGLDDLFFKWGIRINSDLIQDLQCTRIPQVVGFKGDMPQIEKFPWYYDLLVNSVSDHPVSKGISDISMSFVSTIDTLRTESGIKKTVLLTSSRRSKFQMFPMRLTYQILQYNPQVDLFNKQYLPVSVLVEGKFSSFFKNRLTSETEEMLEKINEKFIPESRKEGKMIFVGDGDFVRNEYNSKTGQFTPMGYNRWEDYRFSGNEDFILNSVEYMLDDAGILSARSKRVKLRLLDNAKLFNNKIMLQGLNIGLPLVLLIFFGLIFNSYRKKRFLNQ
ncbi:MAG: gliding motility-associated ABC transporter substrate-binding protein GldG [Deltaproteobacteria bacterium]